jgi:hypothetical protein
MNDNQEPNELDLDSPFSDSAGIQATNDVDQKQLLHFVSTIKNAEQQVGEHIIKALQHADTVAVLTTVIIGPDGTQRIVSAALDPKRMAQVNEILRSAAKEREPQEPCLGFHCLINRKSKQA